MVSDCADDEIEQRTVVSNRSSFTPGCGPPLAIAAAANTLIAANKSPAEGASDPGLAGANGQVIPARMLYLPGSGGSRLRGPGTALGEKCRSSSTGYGAWWLRCRPRDGLPRACPWSKGFSEADSAEQMRPEPA